MKTEEKKYIYESPDKGKTVYRREFGKPERELVKDDKNIKELKNENSR
jgi:hypothetical protein